MASSSSIENYFDGKSSSLKVYTIIADRIAAFGPSEVDLKTQISWGRSRKFAWFWLYNVTKKNPDGVPHLMLALDHEVDSDHVRSVEQMGKHRWNLQIVLRSADDARSEWLTELLHQAYDYGHG